MGHTYGMRGSPAVGGGVPGLPVKKGGSFNDVLASHTVQLNQTMAAGAGSAFPIPFSVASPSELDIIFRATAVDNFWAGPMITLIPTPTGDGDVLNIITGSSFRMFYDVATNSVRISTAGGVNVTGLLQVFKRARKVSAWGIIPAAVYTQSITPFTIKNPAKTWLGSLPDANGMQRVPAFLGDYIPPAGLGWHQMVSASDSQLKITGSTTMSSGANGAKPAYLIEFE